MVMDVDVVHKAQSGSIYMYKTVPFGCGCGYMALAQYGSTAISFSCGCCYTGNVDEGWIVATPA